MELLRQFRKTLTVGGLRVAMEWSQRADTPAPVEALRWLGRGLTRTALPLRVRLARNMRQAGVHRPGLVDQHFERALDQMIMLAHVFRAGFARSGCLERFAFDESFTRLQQAYALGRGVLLIAPHICGYPVIPPVLTPRIPCSIYLRRNKDPRKMRINEAIGQAGDGHLVYPPEGATRAQKLQVAVDVLREGRVLFITPDTLRKPDDGVPVSLFGRTVHFPTGVQVMALRTGAPIVPAWWHWDGGVYRIRFDEPIELPRGGKVRQTAETAARRWAQRVDDFLHEHPAMWWNWLDRSWTKVLRSPV